VEASAFQAPAAITPTRLSVALPLRLRSDDQLVALFRAGCDEAFGVIHDRYRQRLFAYTRQMLPSSRHDAEDALQDVFVRAYRGLRTSDRELALRAWLYRVAHNRCIDELRRPVVPAPELAEVTRAPAQDPIAIAEQRDALRRLIEDVRRLPSQQRSALLMRELSDMSYGELAEALDVSLPAVKSLLVRARVGLAKAAEARDASCVAIREELSLAHDRGVRPNGIARRHLRDCTACREFRRDVRGLSRRFATLTPALGPAAVIAKLLGGGGGAAASGGAIAGGGAVAGGGAIGGVLAGGAVTHAAALLAAAVVAAGGAVELQQTITHASPHHHVRVPAAGSLSAPRAENTLSHALAAITTVAGPVVNETAAVANADDARLPAPASRASRSAAPATSSSAPAAVGAGTLAAAATHAASLGEMTVPEDAYGTAPRGLGDPNAGTSTQDGSTISSTGPSVTIGGGSGPLALGIGGSATQSTGSGSNGTSTGASTSTGSGSGSGSAGSPIAGAASGSNTTSSSQGPSTTGASSASGTQSGSPGELS
jgi:RNA polymerase sigma factor (sigma-70 family)